MIDKFTYDDLHHLAISRIAEYLTKYILTLKGLDVYTTEVDNKGIDFVIRNNQKKYFDIQVKSIRYPNTSYIFIKKEEEWKDNNLRANLILALVVFINNQSPEVYLIPSISFKKETEILKNRKEYKVPEWGINYSKKNIKLFEPFLIKNSTSQKGIIKKIFYASL